MRTVRRVVVVFEQEKVQHMNLQWPKTAAERDLLLRRDALVAEDRHMVVEVLKAGARKVGFGERRPRSRSITSAPSGASNRFTSIGGIGARWAGAGVGDRLLLMR